ncbi:MAG: hypothetical protein H7Y33_12265 [Cytophagales bacterium]|nr:hypothetical protein [Rhizobacter sp.]
MTSLITRQRLLRLASFSSTQLIVQMIGFGSGILLVRYMVQAQYGYYTLAVSMAGMAVTLCDLGLATAVMARGGRLANERAALGALVADAYALHRRLAWGMLAVLIPCCVALLWWQQTPLWQMAALTVLIVATALLGVRAGVALSIVRLLGHVGFQQKLDLAVNLAKLAVLVAATWLVLDATIACLVNLAVAAVSYLALVRHLDAHVELPARAPGLDRPALREHLWKQAPNTVYFVCSSQLALWLIGVFGSAERVAEVGALGRLGALFTLIGSVSSALVLPYFARRHQPGELASGFVGVNAFYACLLATLLVFAWVAPAPILWVLGGNYAGLQAELIWMVAAATLSAWGGAIYGIACARAWVMPVSLSISTGMLATVGAALLVDVSTVRGSFMINTAAGLAGTLAAVGYFAWKLRHHMSPTGLGLEGRR